MDQRRAELLDAAYQVVLDRGLANIRIADVAQATNVSGGLIHYHFATKDVLLTEMMRSAAEQDIARVRAIAAGRGTALERLDRVMRQYVPELGLRPELAAVDRRLGRRPARRVAAGDLRGARRRVVRRASRTCSATVTASGEFVCDDPRGDGAAAVEPARRARACA